MFLKSLEIFGFKSFADRTVINFADGITALLGPNGCGKSNVVDAIKWVLAENRSSNLRAENMKGIVFGGTETRPALGMAEVTLTIANENGLLPMPDDEIAIKRRFYKKDKDNNGENEYFINGTQVGATAIRKLFMDTGVGKAAYSVMEQGKIDQILSSKPEDRRYLFEEAAGISRSKAEVQEAEREIEKTKANLAQINIGFNETKRTYETLKVQAEKTAKYRKLKDEKFECELDIQLLRLKDFSTNKARREQQRKEVEEKRDAAVKEITEIFNSLNENNDKGKQLQIERGEKEKKIMKLGAEQNGKKELLQTYRTQKAGVKEKIGAIESNLKTVRDRIDEINEELDDMEADLFEKRRNLTDMEKNIEGFVQNIKLSSTQIEDNTRLISTNMGKINNLDDEREKLQDQLKAITEDIVTELDAKLKDAGYSSSANRKAKEELDTLLEHIKIFAKGRSNIFKDFADLPSHNEKESSKFAHDAVNAFNELLNMFEELSKSILSYTKTTPQFIDDFLSPQGIITKKRDIDLAIQENYSKIDAIKKENDEIEKTNTGLSQRISEYRSTLEKLRENQSKMIQTITSCQMRIDMTKTNRVREENLLREKEDELNTETKSLSEIDEKIQEIEEEIADLEIKGHRLADELKQLDKEILDCSSEVKDKKEILAKKQQERDRFQENLERLTVEIARSDTEINSVKLNFQENAGRDLMEFEERMYTITATSAHLKEKLTDIKEKINALGQINLSAVEQFAEEKERYERQQENYNDTQKSLENLLRVSEEIRTKSSEMFLDTYNKIRRNFHNMFRRLFNGGRAELRLADPTNVLTSGIEIYAQPPGKNLSNISLLSGGEKTMTAVALLFATYQVRPSPFCLLDEIDAALDDRNVSSFVTTLRSFANVSQYIVITHNRKTVVAASSMIGVSMEESGVTKVVQIRLDEDMINGRATFEDTEEFVEEDVAPEEGVVIPPRPPRREHNPDGSLKIVSPAAQSESSAEGGTQEAQTESSAEDGAQDSQTEPSAEDGAQDSQTEPSAEGGAQDSQEAQEGDFSNSED